MIEPYKYEKYEPKLNDFGDDYHKEKVEITDESSIIDKVKMIRRTYTNYFDYLEAVQLYDRYIEWLIDKYGGENNFKINQLIRNVEEYIPHKPELKMNRKNKNYLKMGITKADIETEYSDDLTCLESPSGKSNVEVDLVSSNGLLSIISRKDKIDQMRQIDAMQGLDELDLWYARFRFSGKKKGGLNARKRDIKKRLKKRTLRSELIKYTNLSTRINNTEISDREAFFGVEDETAISYKGAIYTVADAERMETISLLKELGLKSPKLNRMQTSLIKRNKKKYSTKLTKQRKKAKKKEDRFISEFTHGDFDDFREYEEEMLNLTSRSFK